MVLLEAKARGLGTLCGTMVLLVFLTRAHFSSLFPLKVCSAIGATHTAQLLPIADYGRFAPCRIS